MFHDMDMLVPSTPQTVLMSPKQQASMLGKESLGEQRNQMLGGSGSRVC